MSVYIDAEVRLDEHDIAKAIEQLDEDDIAELVSELSHEAKAAIAKAMEAGGLRVLDRLKIDWDGLDRALERRDMAALERILWPVIRARWPRPKLTNPGASP